MKIQIILVLMAVLLVASSAAVSGAELLQGRFSERNARLLNKLISDNCSNSAGYNPDNRPYIVCDWDNTSAYSDAEETLAYYMATNFLFRVKPADFKAEISYGVPVGNSRLLDDNAVPVSFAALISDLAEDYTWIYTNYSATGGRKTLAEIQATPEHQDFTAKLTVLFDAVDANAANGGVCDEWQGQLFSGFSARQLEQIAAQSIHDNLRNELRNITLKSADSLNRRCKNVSATSFQGMRIYPDMANLYQACMANGIDVYIVSASPEPIILPIATSPAYGYNIPRNHVFGVLYATGNGLFEPALAATRAMTWGPGKETFIKNELIAKKGREPLLICGDSDGDYEMLQAFATTKGLIINRLRGGNIGSLCNIAVQQLTTENPRYLLQGVDQNIGLFNADEATIVFGKTTKRLLK